MTNIKNNKNIEEAVIEYTMNLAFLNYIGLSQSEIVLLISETEISEEDIEMVLTGLAEIENDLADKIIEQGKIIFAESFKKLARRVKMAQGYGEMADININISKEDFHLEDEGAKRIDEMGYEGADKEA